MDLFHYFDVILDRLELLLKEALLLPDRLYLEAVIQQRVDRNALS